MTNDLNAMLNLEQESTLHEDDVTTSRSVAAIGGGAVERSRANAGTATEKVDGMSPTKKKLDSMVLGDGSFEALMKERTKQRKEKDERTLAQLRVQLAAAERALSTEVQRRIESTHAVEVACADQIARMEDTFHRILGERSERIENRVTGLQEKLNALTDAFEKEREAVPRDIERRGKELRASLEKFKEELSSERADRLSREGRMLQGMNDRDAQLHEALRSETETRENVGEELGAKIDATEQGRVVADEQYAQLIDSELRDLKILVDRENVERREEDDQIVGALNRYTEQLRASLSVISS